MPKVVTFDPTRLLIIEIGAGSPLGSANNETAMTEIYSEWKEWVAMTASPSGDLGYPQALRYVGADPLTATQNLGSTFFLTNGWRFKPAEGSHKWTVVGNVFSDPAGQSVFRPTDGTFTVNTETRVSNLVDVGVARLDIAQLLNAIYIDTSRGIPGTGTIAGTQIGTPTLPSNNIADARVIADYFNIRQYNFRGNLTLDQNYDDWNFEGISARDKNLIDLNGQSVDGSRFTLSEITGASSTSVYDAVSCGLNVATSIAGHFDRCGFKSTFALTPGSDATFESCFSEVPGNGTPVCDWNGALSASWRNYSGGLEIQNMGVASPQGTASVDLDPGTLRMGPTNVGGVVKVRGVGEFDDTMGSPSVAVNSSELVRGSDLQKSRKILTNRQHTNPTTGIMVVYDDDDSSIFLQADLFEDVAATQPYRGQGADRRDRLI